MADLVGQSTSAHPPPSMCGDGTQILDHDLARIGRAVAFGRRPVRGHDDVAAFALAGDAVALDDAQMRPDRAHPLPG